MDVYFLKASLTTILLLTLTKFSEKEVKNSFYQPSVKDKCEKLNSIYQEIVTSSIQKEKFQTIFLEEFPDNFKEFTDVYGYRNSKNNSIYEKGCLYELSYQHINIFFKNRKNIPKEVFYAKAFKIGATYDKLWQADGANYFKRNVIRLLINDSEYYKYVASQPEKETFLFLYFLLDTPHPIKEFKDHLKKTKVLKLIEDDKLLCIARKVHSEILDNSGDWGDW